MGAVDKGNWEKYKMECVAHETIVSSTHHRSYSDGKNRLVSLSAVFIQTHIHT